METWREALMNRKHPEGWSIGGHVLYKKEETKSLLTGVGRSRTSCALSSASWDPYHVQCPPSHDRDSMEGNTGRPSQAPGTPATH